MVVADPAATAGRVLIFVGYGSATRTWLGGCMCQGMPESDENRGVDWLRSDRTELTVVVLVLVWCQWWMAVLSTVAVGWG